jgi:formate dehydrogenase iron-sulfur subunit
VKQLHALGESRARLYGANEEFLGGLNSFYLLVDEPEVYGLPKRPAMPTRNLLSSSIFSMAGAVVVGLLAAVGLRQRRMDSRDGRDGDEGGDAGV